MVRNRTMILYQMFDGNEGGEGEQEKEEEEKERR